jgi:hypothetical protein
MNMEHISVTKMTENGFVEKQKLGKLRLARRVTYRGIEAACKSTSAIDAGGEFPKPERR